MAKNRVGRVQRAIRRSFITSGGRPLRTHDFLARAYPQAARYQRKHFTAVYWASRKYAVRIGREGGKVIWGPAPQLAALLEPAKK